MHHRATRSGNILVLETCPLFAKMERQDTASLTTPDRKERGAMSRLAKDNILDLSISERIQLVEDIWDSIAKVPESVQLSEEQKLELDRRLEAYHNDPGTGSPWDVVRERIRGRR